METYPPYRRSWKPCRKCGTAELKSIRGKDTYVGPTDTFEPAFSPPWWKRMFGAKAHSARMRRDCAFCKAVYYEAPADESDARIAIDHANAMLDRAIGVTGKGSARHG
jgi:hypothetical protein